MTLSLKSFYLGSISVELCTKITLHSTLPNRSDRPLQIHACSLHVQFFYKMPLGNVTGSRIQWSFDRYDRWSSLD
jgi:hypothetical protein